jgi:ABC-type bacteriocin/lantibiotic exporter with double-glycine peptidase domain
VKKLLFKRKKSLILYLGACFIPIVTNLSRQAIISSLFGAIAHVEMNTFIWIVIFGLIYIFVEMGLYITSRVLRISYMRDTILDVRIHAFDKILNSSYKHFSKKSKDVYISNLVNDVNNFETNFFINFLNFIVSGGLYLVSVIIMAFLDPLLALIMIFSSIMIFLITRTFQKKTGSLQKQLSTDNEAFTINTSNTFNGLEILKLNNIENKFIEKSVNSINKVEKSKFRFRFLNETQRTITYSLGYLTSMGALIYLLINAKGDINYSNIFFLVSISNNITFAFPDIFPRLNVILSSREIYNKITSLETEIKAVDKQNQFLFNDEIQIKNLTFSFGDKEVFSNAECVIKKGKKYLIKGPSGVGKSTLIKLLSMTYDDYIGTIEVDGVDLKTIKESSFSDNVAFIYQDVFLFEDTIKNNISLYKDLDDTIIDSSIRKAGLSEFVNSKKAGINDLISENGKNLSGGERQRVSIARAIAKQAGILFIDEGTSSVNEDLGKSIEETFLSLDGTVLSISHRYYKGVTDQYDFVLEIKNGKINTYSGVDYFKEEAKYA